MMPTRRWLKKGQARLFKPPRRDVKRAQAPGLHSVGVSDHMRLARVKDSQAAHGNSRDPREVLESTTARQGEGELVLGMRVPRATVCQPPLSPS